MLLFVFFSCAAIVMGAWSQSPFFPPFAQAFFAFCGMWVLGLAIRYISSVPHEIGHLLTVFHFAGKNKDFDEPVEAQVHLFTGKNPYLCSNYYEYLALRRNEPHIQEEIKTIAWAGTNSAVIFIITIAVIGIFCGWANLSGACIFAFLHLGWDFFRSSDRKYIKSPALFDNFDHPFPKGEQSCVLTCVLRKRLRQS